MSDGAAVVAPPQPKPARRARSAVRFNVADWIAWQADAQGEVWREDARRQPASGARTQEPRPALPGQLRRRVTPLGQMAFRAATTLPEIARARFVFCSRHGEYRRTQLLLETLAVSAPPSPAEFSLSVHHALTGLLSIERKNGAGHTAVAAGVDSFGFGLLEAATCITARSDEPVLLVYADEPLPEEYGAFRVETQSVVLALLLVPPRGEEDMLLSVEAAGGHEPGRAATAQALEFMQFLESGAAEAVSQGASVRWRWRRARP